MVKCISIGCLQEENVSEYRKFLALNEYDLQCVIPLFYYQITVCGYYGQYYASTAGNCHIFLYQAMFSTKLLRWLEAYLHEHKLLL